MVLQTFIILNTKLLVFDTQFLVFNTKFMTFTHRKEDNVCIVQQIQTSQALD